jgi:hypothetical protein
MAMKKKIGLIPFLHRCIGILNCKNSLKDNGIGLNKRSTDYTG